MISYDYQTEFVLDDELAITNWIVNTAEEESFEVGDVTYVFCSDEELLKMNQEFLNHNTYTDIISFDYTVGKILQGEIFISIDRVMSNAETYDVSVEQELSRVIIHGILHFCGYKDKTDEESVIMRKMEDYYLLKKL